MSLSLLGAVHLWEAPCWPFGRRKYHLVRLFKRSKRVDNYRQVMVMVRW